MDIRQLRYFVAAVEDGSFSKAAARMNVSQSALGMQIKKLEQELAAELFARHSRGAEVTPAGNTLFSHAKSIAIEMDCAKQAVRGVVESQESNIVIGMTASTSRVLAAALLQKMTKLAPASNVTIMEEMSSVLTERVAEHRITLALAFNSFHVEGLRWEPVLEEPLYFIESAECGKANGGVITLGEVAQHQLALPGVPSSVRNVMEHAAAAQNLTLKVFYNVYSSSIIRTLIAQKTVASVMPLTAVRSELLSGQFIAKRIVEPEIHRELHFVTAKQHPLPRAARIAKRELQFLLRSEVTQPDASWLPLHDRAGAIDRAYVTS